MVGYHSDFRLELVHAGFPWSLTIVLATLSLSSLSFPRSLAPATGLVRALKPEPSHALLDHHI